MTLLEQVSALPTRQPIEVSTEVAGIDLVYLMAHNEDTGEPPFRLHVFFVIGGDQVRVAATVDDPTPVGWWIDTGTWEQLTNELWRLAGGHAEGVSRDDMDEAVESFRHHLESQAWLIRLMVEVCG